MNVYGVTEAWMPGKNSPVTCGIFSTKEKAEEAKRYYEETLNLHGEFVYEIEKWEVDKV